MIQKIRLCSPNYLGFIYENARTTWLKSMHIKNWSKPTQLKQILR